MVDDLSTPLLIRTHAYYCDVTTPSPLLLGQTFHLRIIALDKNSENGKIPLMVQDLKQFSFITDAEVVQLVEELPNYLATADGAAIETEEDKVHWWATHAAALPNWSAADRNRSKKLFKLTFSDLPVLQ